MEKEGFTVRVEARKDVPAVTQPGSFLGSMFVTMIMIVVVVVVVVVAGGAVEIVCFLHDDDTVVDDADSSIGDEVGAEFGGCQPDRFRSVGQVGAQSGDRCTAGELAGQICSHFDCWDADVNRRFVRRRLLVWLAGPRGCGSHDRSNGGDADRPPANGMWCRV
jgi:hypothetical protein